MNLPQNLIALASFLLLALHSCESSRSTHLADAENILERFTQSEESKWDAIHGAPNPQALNATLAEILEDIRSDLSSLRVDSVDAVRMINEELAWHIDEVKRLQHSETRWLEEGQYDDIQRHCEIIASTIPNELNQIFEIAKTPAFMTYLRENSDFCQTNKRIVSPGVEDLQLQNVVLDFYTTVVETLAKGYITSQLAYMAQRAKSSSMEFHKSSLILRHAFTQHLRELKASVRPILQNFTGEIWNCDNFHAEFSYTEIVNFIQGYIDNEINFNREDTCSKQCSDFKHVDYHICRNSTLCILNYLDKNKTRCDGDIRSCEFIESDMHVCPNQENDQIPNRRYHYIRYDSGLQLGRSQFCPYELKVKSWTRWFYHCSYCFCYCDHATSKYTDRYFSLRASVSNIEANKVVTGIRLLKKNRIIHIFIKEGRLGPRGTIESDGGIEELWQSDYKFVKEDWGVKEGVDYHELTWKDRGIEIDTLRAPKGEVVTGARFHISSEHRLRFEIRTTPFNYETGELILPESKSEWQSNNIHDKQKLPIFEADVPIRTPQPSKRIRTKNMYIDFTPTDMHKDIAQTTVPFIDTQPVESKVLKPLIGAGIYYKTTPGYGGFIGPLIILHEDESN